VPSMRIASPERWWRAATAPLIAGVIGWFLSGSFRLALRARAASAGLPLTARIVVSCLGVAVGLWLAALIMRTHLTVSNEGLADHRIFRVVRVPWQQIVGFEIGRPRALWGGFCVTAVCHDGVTIDLMSTRAYSRVPSDRHLDDLQRICWSLEETAEQQPGNP
jgi:hypothetical protein